MKKRKMVVKLEVEGAMDPVLGSIGKIDFCL
jgi:hypothetical protein